MVFRFLIAICGFVSLSAAITLQKPASVSNKAANITLSTQNSTVLNGQDPRFFTLVRDGQQDLTPKSVYMNILQALESLAGLPFEDPFQGERWSAIGYQDVEIAIDPIENLQANFAMWGLYLAVAHIIQKDFCNTEVLMYFNYGPPVGVLEVGTIRIYRPQRSSLSIGGLPSSLPSATATHGQADITNNNTVPLSEDNYSLTIRFNGIRLNKDGIWGAIFEAICEVASWNRTRYLDRRARITDDVKNVEMYFRPSVLPGPPYLNYAPMIFMLTEIPKYMIRVNKFQAGVFVVGVNGEAVGYGELYRLTGAAAVA